MPKKGIIAVLSALVLMVIASVSLVLAVGHNASADSEEIPMVPLGFLNTSNGYLGSDGSGAFRKGTESWFEENERYYVYLFNVTTVCDYAFENCSGLTKVIAPNIIQIGQDAFAGCINLTSIELPESLEYIGNGAFSGCSGLTSITIPSSVTGIGENLFAYCSGLNEIIVRNPDLMTNTNLRSYGSSKLHYGAEQNTVSFVTNCDTSIDDRLIDFGGVTTEPATTLTKEHYTFAGWYLDEQYTKPFTFDTPIKYDITLYAKWEDAKYTVTFETNSEDTVASQTVEYGSTIELPDEPTKTGHNFVGWYRDAEYTEPFNVESPITADVTLYAKWSINQYHVTFMANGGSTVDTQIVNSNTAATQPDDPTREHYTFDGWYTDTECTQAYNFSNAVTSNLTLYAKWIPEIHTVTFDINGTISSQTVEYGATVTAPTIPTQDGYTFIGWYTEDEQLFNLATPITDDITLHAVWGIRYIVNFVTNGGTIISTQTVSQNGKVEQPVAPMQAGYTFAGWYTDDTFATAYDFDNVVTKNLTLYAKWEPAAVEKESPSNNTGAIVAGAVAGSVAGLGMSGGLVAFVVHRKRRKL